MSGGRIAGCGTFVLHQKSLGNLDEGQKLFFAEIPRVFGE
jgi:hypothetical protein